MIIEIMNIKEWIEYKEKSLYRCQQTYKPLMEKGRKGSKQIWKDQTKVDWYTNIIWNGKNQMKRANAITGFLINEKLVLFLQNAI
jgi:hypothetical protein